MNKIRWGIVSTARIGTQKVIPAIQQAEFCDVVAIASRRLETAQDAASRLGIPKAYGSYEELLEDPDVDAVYNPLPNHLHVPVSITALRAGKHVLCEKPIGLSSAEGQQLVDEAARHPRLKVMEAFMYRHHPQWQLARKLVSEGSIGKLRTVQSFFSYFNENPNDIRNQPEMGGGALMDIGCYPVSLSRFLFDSEPKRVLADVQRDPRFHTDRLTSAVLDFGADAGTSTFTCSTQLIGYQRVNIFGDAGRVEIEIPFNAPPDRPCNVWHHHEGKIDEIVLETCNQYSIQADLFARAILDDTDVPTPIQDAVANMRTIEAIFRSGESGHWEEVEQPTTNNQQPITNNQ